MGSLILEKPNTSSRRMSERRRRHNSVWYNVSMDEHEAHDAEELETIAAVIRGIADWMRGRGLRSAVEYLADAKRIEAGDAKAFGAVQLEPNCDEHAYTSEVEDDDEKKLIAMLNVASFRLRSLAQHVQRHGIEVVAADAVTPVVLGMTGLTRRLFDATGIEFLGRPDDFDEEEESDFD